MPSALLDALAVVDALTEVSDLCRRRGWADVAALAEDARDEAAEVACGLREAEATPEA